jgi:hypothetical protein
MRRLIAIGVLALAGLVFAGTLAIPAAAQAAGDDKVYLKRENQSGVLATVDDSDDDPDSATGNGTSKGTTANTKNSKNTKNTHSKNTKNTHSKDSKNSKASKHSKATQTHPSTASRHSTGS